MDILYIIHRDLNNLYPHLRIYIYPYIIGKHCVVYKLRTSHMKDMKM